MDMLPEEDVHVERGWRWDGGRWLRSSRLLRFPSLQQRRLVYDSDAGHFSPVGTTERRFRRAQDIYMESTMGGEFPGEVL